MPSCRLLLALALAHPGGQATPRLTLPLPTTAEADSLLHDRRYLELERWLERPGARTLPSARFFAGILDNRRNRNTHAVSRLTPLLRTITLRSDSAHRHALLETLADSYGKLYRYADAARTLDLLGREFGNTLPDQERHSFVAGAKLRRLLADAPAQRTTLHAPFAVPLRRGSIGLLESIAVVGTDSSWWIVDTGANFSTVSEGMARRLGLHASLDAAATEGISGALVSLHVAVVPLLRIGRAEVRNMVVLVLPDSALYIPQIKYQITAILGYPLLEALRTVTLAPDSLIVSNAAPAGAHAELFLEQLNPLVAATVSGRTDLYHLDTGASTTSFTSHFRDAQPELLAGLAPTQSNMMGAGGVARFPSYELPEVRLSLGTHESVLRKVTVFAAPTPTPFDHFYGNIGQDVFGGAALTLDFRTMTIVLSPRSSP